MFIFKMFGQPIHVQLARSVRTAVGGGGIFSQVKLCIVISKANTQIHQSSGTKRENKSFATVYTGRQGQMHRNRQYFKCIVNNLNIRIQEGNRSMVLQ